MRFAKFAWFLPAGIASRTSFPRTRCCVTLWTSTIGVSPVTVTDSSTAPTRKSAFTVAVNDPASSMPSRLNALNPGSVNVTLYVPGRRSTTLYWPVPSVTTNRTFSINTGLAASTVTPGSTAPDVSFTTPAMDACAYAAAGTSTRDAIVNTIRFKAGIHFSPSPTAAQEPTPWETDDAFEPRLFGHRFEAKPHLLNV